MYTQQDDLRARALQSLGCERLQYVDGRWMPHPGSERWEGDTKIGVAPDPVQPTEGEIAAEMAELARPGRAEIAGELARRMDVGILVDGTPFRCDPVSRGLLSEMVALWPGQVTFRTAAGVEHMWSAVNQATAVRDAVADYVKQLLAAESAVQAAQPDDFADNRHWPERLSVTVPDPA